MNTLLLNRAKNRSLAVIAALAMSGGLLAAQNAAPSNGQRSDGQIEMDVVQALDASQALKDDLITAATIQGQVTLSGTVSSDADRQLAASIAGKVSGVSKVNNNLKIGNPADDPNAQGPVDDGSGPVADNTPPQDMPEPAAQPGYGAPQGNAPQQPGYGQAQGSGSQNPPYSSQQQPNYPPQNYPQRPDYPQQPQGYGQQPGYPPPPGYGPGYPPPPPGYGRQPYAPPAPEYAMPKGPITVPERTVIDLRTTSSLDDKRAKDGTPVDFTVIRDVTVNGYLAIPRGATVHGVVTESKSAGQLGGSPELALTLTSLELGGKSYPLSSDQFKVKGPNKASRTAGNVIGGALLGALIGGAAGGGGGAAIGAAAGGTVGTAASAASSGPRAWIPAEAQVTFHLNAPVTLDPVTREEAARLAQGLYPGGPSLYRRGYGYARAPYPYGAYPYPPVYYRPYYVAGGYYYWR